MSVKALSGQDKYVISAGSDRESFVCTFGSSTVESVSLLNAVTPLFSLNVLKRTGLPLGVRGKLGNRPTTVKSVGGTVRNYYFSSLVSSPNRPRQTVTGFLSALSFTRMQCSRCCSAWLVRSCSSWAPGSIGRLYKYATWMASCTWWASILIPAHRPYITGHPFHPPFFVVVLPLWFVFVFYGAL